GCLGFHRTVSSFPSPTLFRSGGLAAQDLWKVYLPIIVVSFVLMVPVIFVAERHRAHRGALRAAVAGLIVVCALLPAASHGFYTLDRKSTRLNSSHVKISYAVF